MSPRIASLFCLLLVTAASAAESPLLAGVTLASAEARSGNLSHPEYALDGDVRTELSFEWGNGGVSLLLDMGQGCEIDGIRVTNGWKTPVVWLREVSVGADKEHLRPLLGRQVNLPVWRGGDTAEIPLPPAVGRFVRVAFDGGGPTATVAEIALRGRVNRPERHLMCWSGSVQKDFLDKLDYLDHDLGVTDLWIDYVETAFPQTGQNGGLPLWRDTHGLEALKQRGIRYWLAEHEAFTTMVSGPEDLRDDRKWATTLRQAQDVYSRAKAAGFRGLVLDAEDYVGVSAAAKEKYKDAADYVDCWCFNDEFGYAGQYYQRGLQYGRVVKEVWGCPLLQVYEARVYSGKGDCRAGNYWWLKGIHDAGIEIWIATEKTYGAGDGKVPNDEAPAHLKTWFVRLPEFIPKVQEAYPFAARILPGFHPWNARLRKPNYLPSDLDDQLRLAEDCVPGYWIYTEGTGRAGDPREVLDRDFLTKIGVKAEDYLSVFARHATSQTPEAKATK